MHQAADDHRNPFHEFHGRREVKLSGQTLQYIASNEPDAFTVCTFKSIFNRYKITICVLSSNI